jgi:UDP-N-acetylmuramoyl-tripeptide--D-alanyl-D-alanine ligase
VCDELVAIGTRSRIMIEAAQQGDMASSAIYWFPEASSSVGFLQEHLKEGDIVLVKGSLGMAMAQIVTALEASDD